MKPTFLLLISIFVVIFVSLTLFSDSSSSLFFVSAQITKVREILAQREDSLSRLVQRVEISALASCSRLGAFTKTSKTCQAASCGNVFPSEQNFDCTGDYGTDTATCGDDCGSLIRSVNHSTILFAEQTDFNNIEVEKFLAIANEFDRQAEKERDAETAWMGWGSISGTSRWFPGSPRGRTSSSCTPYDPRLRSWFVAASSGPKDIVIVVDVSGSMNNQDCSSCPSRLQLMQTAVKALLDTLTFNDFFAVVSFSDEGSVISSSRGILLQATGSNIESAKRAIDGLYASGGTLFSKGMEKAFSALSSTSEGTSNCHQLILFLTDGIAEDGDFILNFTATKQAELAASNGGITSRIFTYSMSSGADHAIPRAIACNNGGVWASIQNGVNPLNAMAQYYKFLAHQLNSSTTRFVELYEDAFNLGSMTTGSRPVYLREKNSNPIFIGVVAIDVTLKQLLEYATETQITAELTNRGSSCPSSVQQNSNSHLSLCYLQFLRKEAGFMCLNQMTVDECRANNSLDVVSACSSSSSSSSGGVNSMLCDPLNPTSLISTSGAKSYKETVCCPSCRKNLNAGIIVGIVVGSVVVIGVIAFVVKKNSDANKSNNNNNYVSSSTTTSVTTTGSSTSPNPLLQVPLNSVAQANSNPQVLYAGSAATTTNNSYAPNLAYAAQGSNTFTYPSNAPGKSQYLAGSDL